MELVVATDGGAVGAALDDVGSEAAVVGVGVVSVDAGLELARRPQRFRWRRCRQPRASDDRPLIGTLEPGCVGLEAG